jgi:hypothetical protein
MYLLDATDRTLPMNILPERCLNGSGFMVSETEPKWIQIKPGFKSKTAVSGDLMMDGEGRLKGKMSFVRDGYDAQAMRKEYLAKGEEKYVKELAEKSFWELSKSQFENTRVMPDAVKETHEVVIGVQIQSSGSTFYMNPLLCLREGENPFKSETREYPVDFGSPFERTYSCRITLPENLVVDELGKPKLLMLPGNAGKYMFNATQIGNVISVTSQLSINKGLFSQEEYSGLREFYNQVVAKQAEQIVLKKK